ncbi:MAG TPA: MliC family protein [Luteimonas sp.]|nr:MliC family protein [Luteimonas sp.]HRO28005.1 MliC family protein [Luteimonas sp.]HRP71018.1 MliC family protein [Luteimonas sp.]
MSAIHRLLPLVPLTLLLAACTPGQQPAPPAAETPVDMQPSADAAPPPMPDTASAHFRCGDLLVGAVFDNSAGNLSLSINTRQMLLPQAVAASGARYADDQGNEFWNKGDEATLTLDGASLACSVTDEVSPWDDARSRGVVFRGLGTEPFWSLEVDGGPVPQMRLDLAMGERKLVVAQAAALDDGKGYAGTADDGSAVSLRITDGDCSDGMSDQTYPASIALDVGTETFNGCGARLDR